MRGAAFITCLIFSFVVNASEEELMTQLEGNAKAANEAITFCQEYANGWLAHADPQTGLIPRNLTQDYYWNAKDAAADNYPFLALTAEICGLYYLRRASYDIAKQEQDLTNRLGALPDTYDFATQTFLSEKIQLADMVFGSAEYVKDGLLPLIEWTGEVTWLDRMKALVNGIYEETEKVLSPEIVPSDSVEVCGDLMQGMSRLYWMTGDVRYKERCFRLADRYLLEKPVIEFEHVPLRDHGCEVIGGLSEVYVIAAREDKERHARYHPAMNKLLNAICKKGMNEDGMMPNWFNPDTGEQDWTRTSDGWGYVYDAFLTVAEVEQDENLRNIVVHALKNVHKYLGTDWDGGTVDGHADSIEGALNLLNRLPVCSAFQWVDQSMWHIYAKQRQDGIIEGWHGDGNSARTSLMYAFWKTQGVTVNPWREDVNLGAVLDGAGKLHLLIQSEWAWRGFIKIDRPRHRDYMGLPLDYPRINQFPEWFTADEEEQYAVSINGGPASLMAGATLWNLPLSISPGNKAYVVIEPQSSSKQKTPEQEPVLRNMGYVSGTEEAAKAWQESVRGQLAGVLHLNLETAAREKQALNVEILESVRNEKYRRQEVTFNAKEDRRIPAIVTIPENCGQGPFPAVVCIHGHGGTRETVYDEKTIYHGFAGVLAENSFVTLAIDVGQHEVQHAEMTLMGERLWDLICSVDYLVTLSEVDIKRISCAGLSLGGEMAMWFGAMDTRINATVSAGFLTVMNQMERNHCMCWKEEGLRELVDFPDIYALVAPRALLCQIGKEEPFNQFNTVIAERAFGQIRRTYTDLKVTKKARLEIHPGAHEMDVNSLTEFLKSQ
jgi:hypothetical protein